MGHIGVVQSIGWQSYACPSIIDMVHAIDANSAPLITHSNKLIVQLLENRNDYTLNKDGHIAISKYNELAIRDSLTQHRIILHRDGRLSDDTLN